MKIKCSKNVNVIAFEIIGELEKECIRKDIADFLIERLNSNNDIDIKVKENLLLPLGLIDENYELTEKGRECKESEKVWLKEKGAYTLFEIDDNVFNAIIDIEPSSNLKSISELNTRVLPKQEIVSIKNRNKKYRILREDNFFYEMKNFNKNLKINYEIDTEGFSNFYIEDINYGIENKKISIDFEITDISYISILKSLEKNKELVWNEEVGALEVSYNFARNNGEENYFIKNLNFEKEHLEENTYDFRNIFLENITVMPNSRLEANNWYFHRIENLLKDDYIKIEDFNIKNQEEIDCKFLKYYDVEKLDVKEILEKLEKFGNNDEYWNLRAPLDLSFED